MKKILIGLATMFILVLSVGSPVTVSADEGNEIDVNIVNFIEQERIREEGLYRDFINSIKLIGPVKDLSHDEISKINSKFPAIYSKQRELTVKYIDIDGDLYKESTSILEDFRQDIKEVKSTWSYKLDASVHWPLWFILFSIPVLLFCVIDSTKRR